MFPTNLSTQARELAELRKGGLLSEDHFERAIDRLYGDTAPSSHVPRFPIKIQRSMIPIVAGALIGFVGWLGVMVVSLNREVGTHAQRMGTLEKTVVNSAANVEDVVRTLKGQIEAQRERQEESK